MLLYCFKCKKIVARTKNRTIMLLSKCAVCDSKKSKFIGQQEARGLLSSLGIKTPFTHDGCGPFTKNN